MRTAVYIDGFNLYYGAVRPSGHRWLDLGALCGNLLPRDTIVAIRYFTARVRSLPSDPGAPQRQQVYLRALGTIPDLTIHYGRFLKNKKRMALVHPPPNTVEVWNTEEKGSDVNLASYLLVDGFRNRYDLAVLITDDSDLAEPVKLVRDELNRPVGILSPRRRRSYELSPPHLPRGSFYKPIRGGALAASLFPPTLSDAAGTFSKPPTW